MVAITVASVAMHIEDQLVRIVLEFLSQFLNEFNPLLKIGIVEKVDVFVLSAELNQHFLPTKTVFDTYWEIVILRLKPSRF